MSKGNGTNGKAKSNGKQVKNSKPQQWKPGQSGNPKGRPKGPSFRVRALKELEETMHADGKRTLFQAFVDAMINDAIEGDAAARKLLLDRLDPADIKLDVTTQVNPSEVHTLTDRLTLMLPDSGNGKVSD